MKYKNENSLYKALLSYTDYLMNYLTLLDVRIKDWSLSVWLFLFCFGIFVTNLLLLIPSQRQYLNENLVIFLGVLTFPYLLYYLVSGFYRPIPFFYQEDYDYIPFDLSVTVKAFGEFEEKIDLRLFPAFMPNVKKESRRVPFFWGDGSLKRHLEMLYIRLNVKGVLSVFASQLILPKEISHAVSVESVVWGTATIFNKRCPAIKLLIDESEVILVFCDEA